MKRGLVKGLDYDKIQSPLIIASGALAGRYCCSDVRPEWRGFIAPLSDAIAGKAKWHAFAFR